MTYEKDYFQNVNFQKSQLDNYLLSAKKYLKIAKDSDITEVIFKFGYEALIKLGIYLIAKEGYKVRSVIGHHSRILEKMSLILKNEEILQVGDDMRRKRNADLYDSCFSISEKDSKENLEFISKIFNKY